MSALGKRRKPISEHCRRAVQFLVNDEDYIRLLKHSTGHTLSEWCRAKLNMVMDDIERAEQAGDNF